MMKRTLDLVNNPNPDLKGDIILMHDSGGDRSNAVAFLPILIDTHAGQGLSVRAGVGADVPDTRRGKQAC